MKDKIFLLSVEEAEKLPLKIFKSNNWWWLRTPSRYQNCVIGICQYGWIDLIGVDVSSKYKAVRPAIKFDNEEEILNLPRTSKGYYKYLDKKWIDISDYVGFPCLLKKKPFKEARKFDSTSNDYKTSEIRKWLLDWYERETIKRVLTKWHRMVETEPEMTLLPLKVRKYAINTQTCLAEGKGVLKPINVLEQSE